MLNKRLLRLATTTLVFGMLATTVTAEFAIEWHTIDGGGTMDSSGDGFELRSTIGQPDAGSMAGGMFELAGGFWAVGTGVFLPGDCNNDGNIDLADYACFYACLVGPEGGLLTGCDPFDFDSDGDVDLADFSELATITDIP